MARIFLFWLLLSCPFLTQAAVIATLGTQELVNQAELVFEGEVIAVRAVMHDNQRIYTYVDFSIQDVIVGDYTKTTLTLRFSGGTLGYMKMDAGVHLPHQGEKGIYFVERIEPGLVNPILGWQQGHFTLTEENTVLAADNQPVRQVQSASTQGKVEINREGVAKGIATSPDSVTVSVPLQFTYEPLTVEQFKAEIKSLRQN